MQKTNVKFKDHGLQTLIGKDDGQTKKQLREQMDGDQSSVSRRLEAMGKIFGVGRWAPHELTRREKEIQQAICKLLLNRFNTKPCLECSMQMKTGYRLRTKGKRSYAKSGKRQNRVQGQITLEGKQCFLISGIRMVLFGLMFRTQWTGWWPRLPTTIGQAKTCWASIVLGIAAMTTQSNFPLWQFSITRDKQNCSLDGSYSRKSLVRAAYPQNWKIWSQIICIEAARSVEALLSSFEYLKNGLMPGSKRSRESVLAWHPQMTTKIRKMRNQQVRIHWRTDLAAKFRKYTSLHKKLPVSYAYSWYF